MREHGGILPSPVGKVKRRSSRTDDNATIRRMRKAGIPAAPAWLAALLAIFLAQTVDLARTYSICGDEPKHLATGWVLLRDGNCCLGVDNSPVTAWPVLPLLGLGLSADPRIGSQSLTPWESGLVLLFGSPRFERTLFVARLAAISLGALLLLAAYFVARALGGSQAGLIAAALLALDPNIVAHSALIGTDVPLGLGVLLFVGALLLFVERPSPGTGGLLGAAFGLAVLAKFTALLLLPATALLAPLAWQRLRADRKRLLPGCLAAIAAAPAVLWAGYGGHLSQGPPFSSLPGLLPGIREAMRLAREGWYPSYFAGEVGTSWRWYFPVAIALKTPIPLLVAWLVGIAGAVRGLRHGRRAPVALLAVAAVFFLGALVSNLNIGLRHVLPVYPLLAVVGGLALADLRERAGVKSSAFLIPALFVWLAADVGVTHPNQLAFFNVLAGGSRGAVRYLGDSNLDWGQDLGRFKTWMDKTGERELNFSYLGNTDPARYGIVSQPVPPMFYWPARYPIVEGERQLLAVSTNNLQMGGDFWKWVRLARVPYAVPVPSIWVYDISDDPEAHLRLAQLYRDAGQRDLAVAEQAKAARILARQSPRAPEASRTPAGGGSSARP